MKNIKSIIQLDAILQNNHVIYNQDIMKITHSIMRLCDDYATTLEQSDDKQLVNYVKFLETILLYIDVAILGGQHVAFLLNGNDSLPNPCFDRRESVIALFEKNIVDLSSILNGWEVIHDDNSCHFSLLPYKEDSFWKRYPMIVPEKFLFSENLLAELSYQNILEFSKKHIFDLKKENFKVFFKISKIKKKEYKKELMIIALEESGENERLKIFQNSITETYDFHDLDYGSYWKRLYERLKIWKEEK